MRKRTVLSIALYAAVPLLACLAIPAQAQFVPPHMADDYHMDSDSLRDVDNPGSITEEQNDTLGVEIVTGASEQDAINHASQGLIEEDGGVKAIATGSGLGFVSTYTTTYAHSPNINLSRIQQRLAAVQANMLAKAQLVKFLNGSSIEGKQRIAESIMALDTETQQDINSSLSSSEQISSIVSGLARGVVTYDFRDEPNGEHGGTCTVTVVTTPLTRGQAATGMRRDVMHAEDIETLSALLLGELKSGFMPPNGGRTILLPDGQVAWVGFGSAIVRENRDPRMRNRAIKMAKGQAQLRAASALHAVIKGEHIDQADDMAEEFQAANRQFELAMDENENENINSMDETESSAWNATSFQEVVAAKTEGKLPLGCQKNEFRTDDGHWQYCAYIYHPEMTAAAKNPPPRKPGANVPGAGKQTRQPSKQEPEQDRVPESLGKGRVLQADDCPPVPERMAYSTQRLTGFGSSELSYQAALQKALYDVIQQEGIRIKGNSRLSERYEHVLEQAQNEVTEKALSASSHEENIQSWADGVIHSFAVLERTRAKPFEVTLCANIVRFDPKNPRFGLPPTAAVFPATSGRSTFRIEGTEESPASHLERIEAAMEQTLMQSGAVDVIQDNHEPILQEYRETIRQRSNVGEVPIMEALKLGEQLTADYALTVCLQELVVATEVVENSFQKYTKVDADATLICKLMNVGTGQVDWSYATPVRLNRNDVSRARLRGTPMENMDPDEVAVQTSINNAKASLLEYLSSNVAPPKPAATPVGRVARIDRNGLLTCRLTGPGVKVDDILVLEQVIEFTLDGETFEDFEELGEVRVISITPRDTYSLMKVRPLDESLDLSTFTSEDKWVLRQP